MATDYEALRESVRDAYANPPAEMIAEVVEEKGEEAGRAYIELQKRWADTLGDIAVLTMQEIANIVDGKLKTQELIEGMVALSLTGLLNVISRLEEPGAQAAARNLAARKFLMAIRADAELIQDHVDIQHKAN